MFADDTTLLFTGKNVPGIAINLNILASVVLSWTRQNRMALNATKTKRMLLTSQQKRKPMSSKNLDVSFNDSPIQQVRCGKVLGVTFDETASWIEPRVESLCKQLNSRLSLLRRISPYLNKSGTLCFYIACLHSKLLCCSSVWGSCSHNLLLQLLLLQKRAAHIILSADTQHLLRCSFF